MKPAAKISLLLAVAALLVALLIWGYLQNRGEVAREAQSDQPVKPPTRVQARAGGQLVVLDSAALAKSGIRSEPLRTVVRRQQTEAYGVVADVRELLDWRSEYAKGAGELERSGALLEVSRAEHLRLQTLHEDSRNVSEKALQAAAGAWRADEAQVQSARVTLRNLQSGARQRWGQAIAVWLREGSPHLQGLSRGDEALVLLNIPADAPVPAPPSLARIRAGRSDLLPATLVSASPRVNPALQGYSYYYLVSGAGGRLPAGLNVTATLTSGPGTPAVLVPASALVWWQGKAWVYREERPGQFRRLEISTEHPVEGGWLVVKGLSAADRVVVSGAQLLLSEELRSLIEISG